jgi:hypothetical protein
VSRLVLVLVLAAMALPGAATAAGLTLQKVEVDKTGIQGGESNGWTIPDAGQEVVWRPPFGEATYRFPLPQTIPAAGATFTLSLTVTAAPNSRFAPAHRVSGSIVQGGQVTVGATAEPGQTASDAKPVTLVPPTGSAAATAPIVVSVGIQDGPRYTYTYVPVADPPPAPTAFGPNGLISAPSNKKCVSRRNFRIRLRKPRKPLKIEQGIVFVDNKRVATRKGTRVTAPVDLRGLPKGRFTVKITVVLSNGDVVQGKRRYRTCVPKKRRG